MCIRLRDDVAAARQNRRVETSHLTAPDRILAYSVADACRLLSISRRHLYTQIAEGKIRSLKIGARRLIAHAELERLLNGGGD